MALIHRDCAHLKIEELLEVDLSSTMRIGDKVPSAPGRGREESFKMGQRALLLRSALKGNQYTRAYPAKVLAEPYLEGKYPNSAVYPTNKRRKTHL